MKKIILVCLIILTSSCATYDISVMKDNGNIIEYRTKPIYVSPQPFYLRLIPDTGYFLASIFYPFPYLEVDTKEIGVNPYRGLFDVFSLFAGEFYNSHSKLSFIDSNGNLIIYNGDSYKIETHEAKSAKNKSYYYNWDASKGPIPTK